MTAAIFLASGCQGSAKKSDRWMRAGLDALYTRRQPAEAAEDFKKALEATPDHYGATFQLAFALEQAGRKSEADVYWKKMAEMASAVRDTNTEQFARTHLGGGAPKGEDTLMREGLDSLYRGRDYAGAAALFKQVLATNPGHYGANFQLAYALELSGKRDEASLSWMKVLTMAQGIHDEGTARSAREHLAKLAK
jgi:tetratricopeptide (TPR) repeat protein